MSAGFGAIQRHLGRLFWESYFLKMRGHLSCKLGKKDHDEKLLQTLLQEDADLF